ncbi:MAG: UDP-N-acetylmuramate--L-alanine ligase [Clostridia bacterium]|nr:UDP-N-acetylmuramate--L-alanine ligase [Clostridia bacterium]
MSLSNTRHGAEAIAAALQKEKSLFFCGIGGIHMSSLAHIARLRGFSVSGSDRKSSPLTRRLEEEGIRIVYRHDADNLGDAGVFVYTVAISPDNPEYREAVRRGLFLVSRADFLGYIMSAYRHRVGVSGSHGKSTAVSMASHLALACGLDPTVVSGAEYGELGGAYRIGGRENFIFEACEYMDNFLSFCPTTAVILNIEFDHGDYFADLGAIRASFRRYAELALAEGGTVLANADDPSVREALAGLPCRTFGLAETANWRARKITLQNGRPSFEIVAPDGAVFAASLSVPGEHNVYNALAAFASCELCGADRAKAAAALSGFTGAKRRMEFKKTVNGASVFEDYAHHPTEIAATLRAVKATGSRRVVCAFQPHTYSRTAELFDEFAIALAGADEVCLLPIYAARETDDLGVSSEKLAKAIPGAVAYPSFEELAQHLSATLSPGETLLVMGAGDVIRLTDLL